MDMHQHQLAAAGWFAGQAGPLDRLRRSWDRPGDHQPDLLSCAAGGDDGQTLSLCTPGHRADSDDLMIVPPSYPGRHPGRLLSERNAVSDVHDYPPIDRDLAETIWPVLLEQKQATDRLTAEEYTAHVKSTEDLWPADLERGGAVQVTETTIEAASGEQQLPVLILKPSARSGPFPCIYNTANGGKMLQSTTMALTDVEPGWVEDLGVAFITIAPRVGPEHPHPAQVQDAYAGLQWLVKNAGTLGIDPARIIIYGKSGGGGIAAATALYARDQGGPPLAGQMLIYPMIDDRPGNPSSHYDVAPWTRANNQVGWSAILGEAAGGPDVSPYAAAARATDLSGLPPAYLEVGSSEVFRDETLEYASRLARAGVPMEVHSWAGGYHAFEISAPAASISRACIMARTSYLQRALHALES